MALVVFTGGARSGKSRAAEAIVVEHGGTVEVVVFGSSAQDAEMERRIAQHRADRDDSWNVIEATDSVEWTRRVSDRSVVLLDCLGTLLGRVMEEVFLETTGDLLHDAEELPADYEAEVERRFAALIGWIVRRTGDTVVVTNEVGDGVVPAYATGRVFRDVLGRANRSLVDRADHAYLVVVGRVLDLRALPAKPMFRWQRDVRDA